MTSVADLEVENAGIRPYKSQLNLRLPATSLSEGWKRGMSGLEEKIDALVRQVETNREDIEALQRRAEALEAQSVIDRDMIAELQRDGVLSQQHAAQMEEALRSSRTVGAAIGLIMATRQVSDLEAFGILKTASQHSNRKLRDLAAELVAEAN